MSDNAVAFIFKFDSADVADRCSNSINASLRSRLLPLLECPPFAQTLRGSISSPNIQLLTAESSSGAQLFVFFDGSLADVGELFKRVKNCSGRLVSGSCRSSSFNGEVLVLAKKMGVAPGQAVIMTPGSSGDDESESEKPKKKWWQFWK